MNDSWPIKCGLRCKAFSGAGARVYALRCDGPNDPVLVWDSVAGYYTSCHDLSEKTQRRLRAKMYAVVRQGVTR